MRKVNGVRCWVIWVWWRAANISRVVGDLGLVMVRVSVMGGEFEFLFLFNV